MGYVETSAMTGENVEKPFMTLANEILTKISNGTINIELDTAYGVKPGSRVRSQYQNPNI